MSDNSSRKTPPFGSKRPVSSRPGSEGGSSRSAQSDARREFDAEEITDQYEGEDLELHRALRPTDARIGRLEKKADAFKLDQEIMKRDVAGMRSDIKGLSKEVSDTRVTVAQAVGKIDGQESVLRETLSILKTREERDHVTFTAKVDVDRAQELAHIEINKEQQLAQVELNKGQQLAQVDDALDKRKAKRAAWLKALGLASSGAGLIELLHRLGGC